MSIIVNDVTKIYDQQHALDGISFEIKTGEIVGFLGPNGAGKSTMMKIITCFISATQGEVSVCGYNVNTQSMDVRRQVGYLPEHNPLYLEMYVKEYLDFVGRVYRIDKPTKRIAEIVDQVGLGKEQQKQIGQLSKGYRQRVGLAQALIHDPKVLILDEPTSGLDPNQLEDIRKLIKNIGREKTVMLSTHIMQEVEAMCDRVMIINSGKLVADNTASQVRKDSAAQNVTLIEFNKKVSRSQLQKIRGVHNAEHVSGHTWKLFGPLDADVRGAAFQWAVENGLQILTIQQQEQSLEDAFKKLTKNK